MTVTSEWRYEDHINSITFLKLVFQINRYKVKWESSPLHAMFNSDSHEKLFPPPSVPVLPAQLTRIHLVLQGCRTFDSHHGVFSRTLAPSRWFNSSKELFPDTQSQWVLINLTIIGSMHQQPLWTLTPRSLRVKSSWDNGNALLVTCHRFSRHLPLVGLYSITEQSRGFQQMWF